jgi:dihydroorotate dehydrogenase electron transfer subunit
VSAAGDNPPRAARLRLLIATDAGYQPIVRLATQVHGDSEVLVLFGAEEPFAFRPRPSTILVPGMPSGVIACVPALEEFGVASRLANKLGLPGCYDGAVAELAALWLESIEAGMREKVSITVSGADATVTAVEALGNRMSVPVSVLPKQP